MNSLGKMLIVLGGVMLLAGVVLLLAGRAGLPLGRLPGDIAWRGKNSAVYFPITTCILVSVVLSLVFYLIGKLHR